jgi:hypothetical protein
MHSMKMSQIKVKMVYCLQQYMGIPFMKKMGMRSLHRAPVKPGERTEVFGLLIRVLVSCAKK